MSSTQQKREKLGVLGTFAVFTAGIGVFSHFAFSLGSAIFQDLGTGFRPNFVSAFKHKKTIAASTAIGLVCGLSAAGKVAREQREEATSDSIDRVGYRERLARETSDVQSGRSI